jgi:hypothetical protein
MLVDVIRHQHAHVRRALEALASLTATVPERIAGAGREIEHAFADGVPVWAAPYVATVRAVAGGGSDAPRSPDELAALAAALVELYTVACREYWTA